MSKRILDHGYVRFIESWGHGEVGQSEAGIIEAARQSTQGSFRGWEEDKKLLAFLHDNKHATPFEFAGMVIEARAPIFVFREWHRHRTQSYNEMSARYSPLPANDYMPDPSIFFEVQAGGKQAASVKGSEVLTHESAIEWLAELDNAYAVCQACYESGLRRGIPKQWARLPVTVARYSQMRASANLRNWLAFLTLRMDPAAQWEIRQFANAVGEIVAEHFPQTWTLFRGGHHA